MSYFVAPSLENICTINIAACICNEPYAKKEILLQYKTLFNFGDNSYIKLSKWKCKSKSSNDIMEELRLPKPLKNKVMNIINPMKKQIVTWVKYHNYYLNISYDMIIEFLKQNAIIWTIHGNIDKKKVAERLIKNTMLDVKLSFRLACMYCLEDQIVHLWTLMSAKQKHETDKGQWVQPWIDFLDSKQWNVEMFLGNALDETVGVANDVPLIYFMNLLNLKRKERLKEFYNSQDLLKLINNIVNQPWYENEQINYNIDIICYIFSTMTEQEFIHLYEEDKEFLNPKLLFYFLEWPYQKYFMETITRIWNYLPYETFYELSLKIIIKFANVRNHFDQTYDYQLLFKQFWAESPLQFRKYVLSTTSPVQLISKFEVKCFMPENQEIIKLIMNDYTEEEKEEIITSDEGRRICIKLITNEKWEFLDIFIQKCLRSDEGIRKYKHEFLISSRRESICLYLLYENQWDVIEKIMNWVYASAPEELNIRKDFIYTVKNSYDLKILIYDDKWELLDEIITWCLISIQEIQGFKKTFIYEEGLFIYKHLVSISKWKTVERLISWFLSTEEDINKSKKYFFGIMNRKILC